MRVHIPNDRDTTVFLSIDSDGKLRLAIAWDMSHVSDEPTWRCVVYDSFLEPARIFDCRSYTQLTKEIRRLYPWYTHRFEVVPLDEETVRSIVHHAYMWREEDERETDARP